MPAERERDLVRPGRLDGGRDRQRVALEPHVELEPVPEREHGEPVVAAAVVERRGEPRGAAVGAGVDDVPVLRRRQRAVDRQAVLVGAHDAARRGRSSPRAPRPRSASRAAGWPTGAAAAGRTTCRSRATRRARRAGRAAPRRDGSASCRSSRRPGRSSRAARRCDEHDGLELAERDALQGGHERPRLRLARARRAASSRPLAGVRGCRLDAPPPPRAGSPAALPRRRARAQAARARAAAQPGRGGRADRRRDLRGRARRALLRRGRGRRLRAARPGRRRPRASPSWSAGSRSRRCSPTAAGCSSCTTRSGRRGRRHTARSALEWRARDARDHGRQTRARCRSA